MSEQRYNFADFVGRVKTKSLGEIKRDANAEAQRAERESSGVKGARKARSEGSVHYTTAIKSLLNYLEHHGRLRPGALSEQDFQALRPLCEQLVRLGHFSDETLALFTKRGANDG